MDSIQPSPVVPTPVATPLSDETMTARMKRNMLKHKLAPLIAVGVVLLLVGAYLIYSKLTSVKPIATLTYDSAATQGVLAGEFPFAFTRGEELYVGNMSGSESPITKAEGVVGKQIGHLRLSPTKKYITWTSSEGILALHVASRNLYLIDKNGKQVYDLNPKLDKILYINGESIQEAALPGQKIRTVATLPQKTNNFPFNQVIYSPNGYWAYLRSIGSGDPTGLKDYLVAMTDGKVSELPLGFTMPNGFAPQWFADSSRIASFSYLRAQQYNLSSQEITALDQNIPRDSDSFALSPQGKQLIFKSYGDKFTEASASALSNPTYTSADLVTLNLENGSKTTVVNSHGEEVKKNKIQSMFNQFGWVNENKLWFKASTSSDHAESLWIINRDGQGLKKVLTEVENTSLFDMQAAMFGML